MDDVKTIYCLPVRWGPGLSWGDTFRTPVVSERRQSWAAGVPRERLECSGSCLGPVCLEVLVGVRGGAVVYCWSGQGIAWSDLESLNKSGPQFELLCCWEKLRRKQEVGEKSHLCPLRLSVGPRELSYEMYA